MFRVSNPVLPWLGWGSLSDWDHSRWELHQTVHSYHTQTKRTNSAFLWGFMSVKVFLTRLSSQTDLRTSFKTARTNSESQNPVMYCLILPVNNHLSKAVLQCSSLNTSCVVSDEPDSVPSVCPVCKWILWPPPPLLHLKVAVKISLKW